MEWVYTSKTTMQGSITLVHLCLEYSAPCIIESFFAKGIDFIDTILILLMRE